MHDVGIAALQHAAHFSRPCGQSADRPGGQARRRASGWANRVRLARQGDLRRSSLFIPDRGEMTITLVKESAAICRSFNAQSEQNIYGPVHRCETFAPVDTYVSFSPHSTG